MAEIIYDVDIDGNGQVEFPEFCVMMKKIMKVGFNMVKETWGNKIIKN